MQRQERDGKPQRKQVGANDRQRQTTTDNSIVRWSPSSESSDLHLQAPLVLNEASSGEKNQSAAGVGTF
ncbi:hypothetical protein F2P81_006687 [Scophthalmus maximus]|uniref:Uncharacterized protein n=1 Tax=Scophthalmus maximus TaxID=52904 RepID=A0A6A4T7G1_SCOMX|nr:hypothetical protein F2P81_006687 [Scophthalmus maximus]